MRWGEYILEFDFSDMFKYPELSMLWCLLICVYVWRIWIATWIADRKNIAEPQDNRNFG